MPRKGPVRKAGTPLASASTGPALWRYIQTIYADLDKGAEDMMVDGVKTRVFTGAMTGLLSKHRISSPYYGPLTHCLRDLGAAHMIQRGNGFRESMYEVGNKPTRAAFDAWNKKEGKRNYAARNRTVEHQKLLQEVADLRKQLGAVNIPKAFAELTKDIKRLTARVDKIEKGLASKS